MKIQRYEMMCDIAVDEYGNQICVPVGSYQGEWVRYSDIEHLIPLEKELPDSFGAWWFFETNDDQWEVRILMGVMPKKKGRWIKIEEPPKPEEKV